MGAVKSVSIVVPVYREKESLPILIGELQAVAGTLPALSWEFIFVDDGSDDGSADVVKEAAAKDPRVKAVVFTRNYGQTAAMSCGISMAKGDVIIPMDADLQNDPADIPLFLKKIEEGFTCVSGWRKDRKDLMLSRKVPSWIANGLIAGMTGVRLHDFGCSLKAYRREIIQDVTLYGEMHRFIPVYAAWIGGRVAEVEVHHRPRRFGSSKYGLSRIPKVLLDLLVIKFLLRYFTRPMHFFGFAGFISLALGVLAEIVAVYYKLTGQKSFVETPLPTIGVMFLIVGIQFILTGLVAEVLMRTYFETQKKKPYAIRETVGV